MFRILLLTLALLLSGCITSGKVPLTVHHIDSLETVEVGGGSFRGLEELAVPVPDSTRKRVNILYLHGIGFTEDRNADQLGADFLSGIAQAYDLEAVDGLSMSLCGQPPLEPGQAQKPYLYLRGDTPREFPVALPDSKLRLNDLACMDKQTLVIGEDLEFVLYRVFWDNIFWDELQFAHVGQDDNQGSSRDIAGLRRKYNRVLKDNLVNYGFSDAVMYLGPAGETIREAVAGAMCAAALDAGGESFAAQSGRDDRIAYSKACRTANATSPDFGRFAFVTESLGSKIVFDVMRQKLSDNRYSVHDDMIAASEVYMLANQIPLLSLSDMDAQHTQKAKVQSANERARVIALSEINDFLSYELVPFYEQLFRRSIRPNQIPNGATTVDRARIIDHLGFDIVDMRIEFADKVVPILKGFVDPKEAHTGHAGQPDLMLYILCGAEGGARSDADCVAAGTEE